MATPPGVVFLVDSNELAGDHLGYLLEPRIVKKLHVGDYSVMTPEGQSLEDEIVIERKSLVNLLGDSCGENRARFERCLERLARVRYPALVVEASWLEILSGNYEHTRLDPRAATGSLIAWSMRFGVHPWLVGDEKEGMELTRRLLVRAALDRVAPRVAASRDPSPSEVTDGGVTSSGASSAGA